MIPSERRRTLIFPREHGAWGILLVPLITGASAGLSGGHTGWSLPPLTILVLALFWLRTPVENWMGTVPTKARTADECKLVRTAAVILGAVSAVAAVAVFWGWRNLGLLGIGAIATVAFIGQAVVRQTWRSARTSAQMIGAAGLTAVGPAAYYVVVGDLNGTAWALWLLNFAFAANQIQFVQLRIRAARITSAPEKLAFGRAFIAAQIVLGLLLIAGCVTHRWSWYVSLAFLPVLWRGFAWFVSAFQPLAVHALGKRELTYAIVFGAVLIVAFA